MQVSALRGKYIETVHSVAWVWVNAAGQLLGASKEVPGETFCSWFRSAAKPLQALAVAALLPQWDSIPLQAWAVACGSHEGTPDHQHWAGWWLTHAGLTEADLQCGSHPPLAAGTFGDHHSPVANNCSGKHGAMLAACVAQHWPLSTYLQPEHPLQRAIMQTVAHYSQQTVESVAVDGCGVPTFYLPLLAMAQAFVRWPFESDAGALLAQAMSEHVSLVAGKTRWDTAIMTATQGQILSKVGAEGLVCLVHRIRQEAVVLKTLDGQGLAREMAALHWLYHQGWLTRAQRDHQALQFWTAMERTNWVGTVIGRWQVV